MKVDTIKREINDVDLQTAIDIMRNNTAYTHMQLVYNEADTAIGMRWHNKHTSEEIAYYDFNEKKLTVKSRVFQLVRMSVS